MGRRLNRRQLIAIGGMSLAAAVAACQSQAIEVPTKAPDKPVGGTAPAPTQAPAASGAAPAASTPAAAAISAPAAAATPAPAGQPAAAAQPAAPAGVPSVPRNETLIWSVSDELNQFGDTQLFNPFIQGARR